MDEGKQPGSCMVLDDHLSEYEGYCFLDSTKQRTLSGAIPRGDSRGANRKDSSMIGFGDGKPAKMMTKNAGPLMSDCTL